MGHAGGCEAVTQFAHGTEKLGEIAWLSWTLGTALFTSVYFALYLSGLPGTAAVVLALAAAATGTLVGACALSSTRRHGVCPEGGSWALVAAGLTMATAQTIATI